MATITVVQNVTRREPVLVEIPAELVVADETAGGTAVSFSVFGGPFRNVTIYGVAYEVSSHGTLVFVPSLTPSELK